jgi:hypothetical protein
MNDNNELITKGFLRETLKEAFEDFTNTVIADLVRIIGKSFENMESRMAKQEDLLALTARVDVQIGRLDHGVTRLEQHI